MDLSELQQAIAKEGTNSKLARQRSAKCNQRLGLDGELVERVKTGQVPAQDSPLYQYHKVWPELGIRDGLVMKGDKIVIPQTNLGGEESDLRHWVVEVAQDGHVGGPATKRTLRKRLWFPGMDRLIDARIRSCGPSRDGGGSDTRSDTN